MRVNRKKLICMFMLTVLMIIFTGCGKDGKDNEKESEPSETYTEETSDPSEDTSGDEGESLGEDSTEDEFDLGYKYDVATNWKMAYADTDYIYYYLMVTTDTYDSNVVLSVTSDKSLAGIELTVLEESLRKQYGDNVYIEKGVTKENGENMLYMELEQMNGDEKARIGQYVVVGKERAVIFSVYSEERKFTRAKKYAGYAVNTIAFEVQ